MKIKDGFVLEEVGGSYLAVAVGERAESFHGFVRMNGTGVFLWNILSENDVSRDELVKAITDKYDIDADTAMRDVVMFEEKLRGAGIIE